MKNHPAGACFAGLAIAACCSMAGCKSSSSPDDGGQNRDVGADVAQNVDLAPNPDCPIGMDDLISDFTSNNAIYPTDGRQGGWYVYGDPAGTFDPPKVDTAPYPIDATTGNPTCSGPGSLRLKATGFTGFGAAMGTDFKPRLPGIDGGVGPKGTYDASKYRGVAFWAKSAAPLKFVQVKFPDVNTDVDAPSPVCILNPNSQSNCSPYLVKFGVAADAGTTDFSKYANDQIDMTWRRFEILFADTKQDADNPGLVPADDKLDVAHLLGMAIQVNADFSTTPPTANDFELWIDDVQFIR
jgi:hypothetical protein